MQRRKKKEKEKANNKRRGKNSKLDNVNFFIYSVRKGSQTSYEVSLCGTTLLFISRQDRDDSNFYICGSVMTWAVEVPCNRFVVVISDVAKMLHDPVPQSLSSLPNI